MDGAAEVSDETDDEEAGVRVGLLNEELLLSVTVEVTFHPVGWDEDVVLVVVTLVLAWANAYVRVLVTVRVVE